MSELSPQARALLEAGRAGDTPTAADKERIRQKLAARLAQAPAPTSATPEAPAESRPLARWPWKAGGLLMAVAGLVAFRLLLANAPEETARTEAPAAVVEAPPPAAPRVPEPPPTEVSAVAPVAAPPPVSPPPPTPQVSRARPRREPKPATVPAPAAVQPASAQASPPEPLGGGGLEEELKLLREAEAARRSGKPELALERLRTHATRFPEGLLSAEREASEVLVRCDLGQVSEATRLARAFEQRHPSSPLRRAVQASCATNAGGKEN